MAVRGADYTSIRDVLNGEGEIANWAMNRPGEALAVLLAFTLFLVLIVER
jgi:hypothetical protein